MFKDITLADKDETLFEGILHVRKRSGFLSFIKCPEGV